MNILGGGLSVAASTTAVIAAFHEADTQIQRLKVKLVSRRLPLPPEQLEDTVFQAPEEIERAKRRGVERFGTSFEQGDHFAVMTIQQIVIQMQSGLLPQLRAACTEDEEVDFWGLVDMADSARDGTISALIALRQRLMQQAGSNSINAPAPPPTIIQPGGSLPASRKSSIAPPVPARDLRRPPRDSLDPQEATGGHESDVSGTSEGHQAGHRRSGSLFGLLKRNPNRTTSDDYIQSAPPPPPLQPRLSRASNSSYHPHSGTFSQTEEGVVSPIRDYDGNPRFSFRDAGNNNFETYAADHTAHSMYAPTDNHSTFSRGDSRTNSMLSNPASSTAPTTTTSTTHQGKPRSAGIILATPSPQNDYLGFCKGAWKAQNSDPKAMIDRRDFAQTAQSQMSYPSCSKCAFKGHEDSKRIWNKVNVDEGRGLKYRWAFLAKSHVKQKSVKERNYAYQCLFCVFAGQKEPVIYTQNTYLDHVSKEHRREGLSDVVLDRTRCINDRVCGNNEKFDINLFPVVREEPDIEKTRMMFQHFGVESHAFELAA